MSGFDISGVVLGGLGLTGFFQSLYSILHYNLPAQQFAKLQEVLQETTVLFQSVIEEGIIRDATWVNHIEAQLLRTHAAAGLVQTEVFASPTFKQQLIARASGLSGKIRRLNGQIVALRAQIAERSDQAMKAQENASATASDLFIHSTGSHGLPLANVVDMEATISAVAASSVSTQTAIRRYINEQPDRANPRNTALPQQTSAGQIDLLQNELTELNEAISELTRRINDRND